MTKKLVTAAVTAAMFVNTVTIITGCAKESNDIKVIYDGKELELTTSPQIVSDTTLVPMRQIFEAFGAKVKWDSETQTVTAKKESKTITMTIDSEEITKNDETVTASVAPQIIDGSTMVPIRVISELLGLDVEWDSDNRRVIITTPEEEDDDEWKNNTGSINLTNMTVSGDGVTVEGNVITISEGGDFTVSGTNDDASIVVNAYDEDGEKSKVKLRLNGAELTNPDGAAINVIAADKLYITLEDGTENIISDGEEYTDTEVNACIYSKDDLEIKGDGSLTVNGNYNHGIVCKDSMEISNGNIVINAKNDGIHVNDTMLVSGGDVEITAEGDGISSDEIFDITDGSVKITTTGEVKSTFFAPDGGGRGDQQAPNMPDAPNTNENDTSTKDTSTEGTNIENTNTEDGTSESDVSSKGIKAGWMITINGGEIEVSSTDHAIHSSGEIDLNDGELTLSSSSGKGISGHEDVNLNGTTVNILNATEGIESKQILTINDGDIDITCTDDGLNAGGGDDTMPGGGGGMPGGGGGMPGGGGGMPGGGGNQPQAMPSDGQSGTGDNQQPQAMPGGGGGMGMRGGMRGGGGQPNGDGNQPPEMQNGEQSNSEQSNENGDGNMTPGGGRRGGRGAMDQSQAASSDTESSSEQSDTETAPSMNDEQRPDGGGMRGGGGQPNGGGGFGGSDSQEVSTEHHIQINGGNVTINAKGDGIDSNGSIVMDGGYVVVNGPSSSGDCAIDHGSFTQINGGTLIAVGSSGMVEEPSSSSEQYVISAYTSQEHEAGELVTICDSDGNIVLSIAPLKAYGHILFSSDALEEGETYTIYEGGKCTGTINSETGVYTGGKLSDAEEGSSGEAKEDNTIINIGSRSNEQMQQNEMK